jgi:hypothetical protein
MTFQAVLLLGFIFIVTGQIKRVAPNLPSWTTPIIAAIVGIGSVFLIGESDWASEQLIAGQTLDQLNDYSKGVAGIFAGVGGAPLIDKTINTVASIGENQTKPPAD